MKQYLMIFAVLIISVIMINSGREDLDSLDNIEQRIQGTWEWSESSFQGDPINLIIHFDENLFVLLSEEGKAQKFGYYELDESDGFYTLVLSEFPDDEGTYEEHFSVRGSMGGYALMMIKGVMNGTDIPVQRSEIHLSPADID